MATHSAPPSFDAVEDGIRAIAPLLREHVEPHIRLPSSTDVDDSRVHDTADWLPRADPIHYVRLLASCRGSIPPGSQAEGLWKVARVLMATLFYCRRLDPLQAELREVIRTGADPKDPSIRDAVQRRILESAPGIDDSAENTFLDALERLDGLSQKAQQATVAKLCHTPADPFLAAPVALRYREVVMADIRESLREMLAAARGAFAVDDGTEFPRTRRDWNRTVSRLGADLKRLGFKHREVASIFPGVDVGSNESDEELRASERARQRTRRRRSKITGA